MYRNKIVFIAVFGSIIFFVMRHSATVGVSVLETASSYCLYPLLKAQQMVVEPMSRWMHRSNSLVELEQTIETLQKKHDQLAVDHIALKALCQYADDTDELRTFNQRYALHKGSVAQVLARHFSPNNQFFLVDMGSADGIKKDMVALYGNAIVGRVVEVYPWYCKVSLITDVDCKVAALCLPYSTKLSSTHKGAQGANKLNKGAFKGATGIHEGVNDVTRTSIRYVSHLESVHEGDDILSSGEGLVFPKGFLLGKIISADKGELFYTITVQPSLDFQALRYCTLIAKEDI